MEAYRTRVMELLSLRKTLECEYQLEIVVTEENRQAAYVMPIDEGTYLALEALQPLNGGRVRLSPYPKWDPYRQTYYSSAIRMNGSSRETLYFVCSETYVEHLKRIQTMEFPPVSPEADVMIESFAKRRGNPPLIQVRWFSSRASFAAGRLLIACWLLALLFIPTARIGKTEPLGSLGGDGSSANSVAVADKVEPPPSPIANTTAEGQAVQNDLSATVATDSSSTDGDSADVPADPPATPKDYEVVDIDEGKEFFGLPKSQVALTFDDGPSVRTQQIVDILAGQQVAATFLFVGKNVEHYPDAVTYASEHGMSIGNHSWDHSILTKASPAEQKDNLAKTNSLLESLTHTPITVFRPPYGAVNDGLILAAKGQNMKTLMWNRDPEDWKAKGPDDILRYFHEVEVPGGVYVMHEDKYTLEALPEIIRYLKEKNLTFVAFK